jgi:hypothetical protein
MALAVVMLTVLAAHFPRCAGAQTDSALWTPSWPVGSDSRSLVFEPVSPPIHEGQALGQPPPGGERSIRLCRRVLRGCELECGFLVRGYYVNDQRIEWSGQEATFGAEAILTPWIRRDFGAWQMRTEGEFYLNQPFDKSILTDTQERRSYAANFDVDTFEISQLYVAARRGSLELTAGKFVTPFGRTYFPLYTNARIDAPFIRTESILWRETGALLRCDPGWFVGEIAVTNGCEDRDTNSSKAVISRVGVQGDWFAAGFSVKVQDGIGSESHKEYKNHVGADLMVRRGDLTLSGEVIYDEYGFRRPGFDPDHITWKRSIYYRDLNYRTGVPITGIGYYVNLGWDRGPWITSLNYGEFYPEEIGDPRHDVVNRRAIVKAALAVTPYLQAYTVVMIESDGYLAQCNKYRRGEFVLVGAASTF